MSPEFLYAALTVGSAVFALWCLWSLCWGVVPFTAKAKAKKYIEDQDKRDIALDKLSVKEYEDPFKGGK